MKTIDTLLAEARTRLRRLTPQQARDAWASGALLIDIRPAEQRRRAGEIPGATVLERNVLEWRLDPASPDAIAAIEGYQQQVIVFCQEGYASSLAAASLQDLGLVNATDLDGGIAAWAKAGLPVRRDGRDQCPVRIRGERGPRQRASGLTRSSSTDTPNVSTTNAAIAARSQRTS